MRGSGRWMGRAWTGEESNKLPPMGKILAGFWPFLRPYWAPVLIGTVSVTLVAILNKAPPLIIRRLLDHVLVPVIENPPDPASYTGAIHATLVLLGALLAVGLLTSVLMAIRFYTLHRAGEGFVMNLRVRLYSHLQRLSLSYYETRQTGDIMSRVTGDSGAMQNLLTHASDSLISDLLNLFVTAGIMFYLSWRLTLAAILPVPVMIVMMFFFSRFVRPIYRKLRDRLGQINARLHDNLAGIRVIKSFNRTDYEEKRFADETREYFDAAIHAMRIWTLFFPLMNFIQGLGSLAVLGYGAYLIIQPERLVSVGDLIAFTMYTHSFYSPIGNLFRIYNAVLQALSSGERILEVLEQVPETRDTVDAMDLPRVIEGCVQFENVSFRYPTGDEVLSGISMEARPGETIALVGRSGAGKTSIVNLIPRFYDPSAGRILIDGHDIRFVTQDSLRRNIALVLQDTFLFNGTVKENIRYGRLEATDDQIRAAAATANALDFIEALAGGFDTEIGERGVKLSGGQKQRISIARAVLADPRILILDEATSMVDSESEYLIQQALVKLVAGRTTFIIAHRLSTIKRADQILVLEDGKLVERGRHEELAATGGVYASMMTFQQWTWNEKGDGDTSESTDEEIAGPASKPDIPEKDKQLLGLR